MSLHIHLAHFFPQMKKYPHRKVKNNLRGMKVCMQYTFRNHISKARRVPVRFYFRIFRSFYGWFTIRYSDCPSNRKDSNKGVIDVNTVKNDVNYCGTSVDHNKYFNPNMVHKYDSKRFVTSCWHTAALTDLSKLVPHIPVTYCRYPLLWRILHTPPVRVSSYHHYYYCFYGYFCYYCCYWGCYGCYYCYLHRVQQH